MVIDMSSGTFIVVIPGLGLDVRVRMRDCIEMSNGAITDIVKRHELPDSELGISWKDGTVEEHPVFGKMRVRLSSRLKIPLDTTVCIIEPSKRKYVKAANASAINGAEEMANEEESENENNAAVQSLVVDVNEEEERIRNAEVDSPEVLSPVAMTLESQLKVGAADSYNAHYD